MKSIVPASDREILSTRHFDWPPARVFAAFADPAQLAHWWGPNGFANHIHEFDLRPGGMWRLTMVGPDGARFTNVSRFLEVAAPGRIVYQHEDAVHGFQMNMTFAADGAGTKVAWRMTFDSPDEFARVRDVVTVANEQNFDRLAAYLAHRH